MRELTMPKLSDSMADAVIVRWLKSEGDSFARGDGLIEVETDKATVVYEAEADGRLDSILAPEGASVAVGEPIATLANGALPQAQRPSSESGVSPQESDGKRPNATPVARRTAVELGVSLHGVAGSGQGGRITREDVQRAAQSTGTQRQPTGGKGDARVVELTATQATIARRMVESATSIPVFTVSADIDMSLVVALRRGARDEGEEVPSLNDFIVKAAALTLRDFPRFNASFADGKLECHSRINVGIAVSTDDALLVPVIFDADRKTLAAIASDARRLAEAARRRTLEAHDLSDATFTVSNLGMFGVRSFTAIIDPPQVAILAVGGVLGEVMIVTLSCDHRVVYGADGARFLNRLQELLERPLVLLT
ncbi:MAG: dihydrolipoamide acetyltransferase family protein [Gaiellaceae bacterium]